MGARDRINEPMRTINMIHWDMLHARKKRLSNLLVWSTGSGHRKMIAEMLE